MSAFSDRKRSLLLLILGFVVIGFFAQKIIQNFPNSADEYAYIFQAYNLAQGQVYADVHPYDSSGFRLQNYFWMVHVGDNYDQYYGRFPPGYSLLLVPSVWLESLLGWDTYWMVNALFGALTLLLIFKFADRFFGRKTAWIATIIGFANPWFLLTSGSFFSQTTCAYFIALAMYLLLRSVDFSGQAKEVRYLLYSGAAFGFAMLVRYLDPLAFIVPGLIIYLGFLHRAGQLKWGKTLANIGWFALTSSACVGSLLLYNKALTGEFMTTAYEFYNPLDSGTRFIFQVIDRSGNIEYDYSRIKTVGWLGISWPNIKLLMVWFAFAWALVLLPMYFIYGKQKLLISGLLLAIISEVTIYTLYGGPPMNQYGPRYFYAFYVPIVLVVAAILGTVFRGNWRFSSVIAVFGLSYFSLHSLLIQSQYFYDQIFDRRNLYRTVEAAELSNAVVFVSTPSGTMHNVDLTRNDLEFKNDVLYVQDLNRNYLPIMNYYPEKSFYIYRYRNKHTLGRLTQVYLDKYGELSYNAADSYIPKTDAELEGYGLMGHYFKGDNFNELVERKVDLRVNFDWGSQSPLAVLEPDYFSVRWQGEIDIVTPGVYRFFIESDDGSRLFINDEMLIDNWGGHGPLELNGEIYLEPGLHKVKIEYMDRLFGAKMKWSVIAPGEKKRIVPAHWLIPAKW